MKHRPVPNYERMHSEDQCCLCACGLMGPNFVSGIHVASSYKDLRLRAILLLSSRQCPPDIQVPSLVTSSLWRYGIHRCIPDIFWSNASHKGVRMPFCLLALFISPSPPCVGTPRSFVVTYSPRWGCSLWKHPEEHPLSP